MSTTTTTSEVHTPAHTPRLIHAIILLITSGLTVLVSAILGPNVENLKAHFAPMIENVDYWVPLAVTVPIGVFGLCAIFIGGLSDRVGRKNLLVYSTLLYAVVGTMPLYIDAFWTIFASRIALGVLEAALMTASTTMIGDYYAGVKREKMMSLQTTTASATATVFVAIGTAVGTLSWNAPFAIYGLAILLFPLMVKYLWEPKPMHASAGEAADAHVQDAPGVTFRPKLLAVSCVVAFISGIVFMALIANLATLYVQGGWPQNIGTGYTLNSFAVMAATFVFGWVLVGRVSVSMQLFLSCLIAGIGFVMMGKAGDGMAMTIGAIVNGFGCGLLLPTTVTWNMRSLPFAKRGFGTGAFMSAQTLGMAISPAIVVYMGKVYGSMASGVGQLGLITIALGVVALVIGLVKKS